MVAEALPSDKTPANLEKNRVEKNKRWVARSVSFCTAPYPETRTSLLQTNFLKPGTLTLAYNPSAMKSGCFQAPGQPELHSEFWASLSYVVRLCLSPLILRSSALKDRIVK